MRSLVSVVIPTYSRPTYLDRAISSVLKQTYSPIEIIVVDDNNPDTVERRETEKTMEKYSGNLSIKYIQHEKNKNGSAARNTGLRIARGKYITFLDDDDEIEPSKLERQIDELETLGDEWGACYTAYKTLRPNEVVEHSFENRSGECYVYALMKTMFLGSGSNLLVRKCIADQIGGYDESFKRSQDLEFLVRVTEQTKIAFVNEELLIIHWEDGRKKTYKEVAGYCDYYRKVFQDRINNLPEIDRERVITVITLDQCKIALVYKEYKEIIRLLRDNQIKGKYVVKYIRYLLDRVIKHKSYGFYI